MAEQFKLTPVEFIRSAICAIWFLIILIVVMIIVVPLHIISLGKLRDWINTNFGYLIGKSCLIILGVKLHIHFKEGEKPKGPAVFIINHSSTLDLFILLALRLPKIRFVAKKEFQYNPLFLILGNLTDHIFIDRSSSEKAVITLQNAIHKVRSKGLSVLFAPEGTRKHPGVIGPFKRGAFHMALNLNYPIQPIYIHGARDLCPGDTAFSKTGDIDITYHEMIDTSDWNEENVHQLINQTREKYLDWAGVSEDLQEA